VVLLMVGAMGTQPDVHALSVSKNRTG